MNLDVARRFVGLPGDVWEVGVYRGDSAIQLAPLRRPKQALRLFDTFTGLPPGGPEDGPPHKPSFVQTSLAHVQERLAGEPDVYLHPGLVPETFQGLDAAQIALAYIDLDLYAGTAEALAFILPRLVPGGAAFVDDVVAVKWPGPGLAVAARPEPWTLVDGCRALFIKEST